MTAWSDSTGVRGARRIVYWVARLWFRGLFYGQTLKGRIPGRLMALSSDLWPGNADHGRLILDGYFRFQNRDARRENVLSGTVRPGEAWMVEFHRCGWLHDIRATQEEGAPEIARTLVGAWIRKNSSWNALSWRPDILSARISNWLSNAAYLALDDDPAFAGVFLDHLARQSRHLRRVSRFIESEPDRLAADTALLYSALCIGGSIPHVNDLLLRVVATSERQFFPDGGHVWRSPARQLEALRQIVDIRDVATEAGFEVTESFKQLVRRVASVTRFFCHGDRRLALFNGSEEGDAQLIDLILSKVKGADKPATSTPDLGFERIEAHRTLLIVDGGSPGVGVDGMHAGTLSFELSVARQRIIVNCGAIRGGDEGWRAVQSSTAAHSTLTVGDRNSSTVGEDGRLATVPGTVTCERSEDENHTVLSMSHDGYHARFRLTHYRRIAVERDGARIHGRDLLSGAGEHRFTVRFHLHPTVKASLLREGASVLLRLLDGSGWRFRCDGGIISLHESVYLGQAGRIRRSEQIVVSGATLRGEAVVEWNLAKL